MSLCIYGRIEKEIFDENTLEPFINQYFSKNYEIIKKDNGKTYEIKKGENTTILSFIKEKKYPYNIYESDIAKDGFEYRQLLIFDLDKEDASTTTYTEIIDFLGFLFEKTKSRILVTSDSHDEICIFDFLSHALHRHGR